MPNRISIHQAPNTLAPVLAVIESLGFRVWHEFDRPGVKVYCAENGQFSVSAYDPIALLGLIRMLELRGDKWMPSNPEVERYLQFEELPPNKSLEHARER